jgi:hypothetical protein
MLTGHTYYFFILQASQQARISFLSSANALQQPIGVSKKVQEPVWWKQRKQSCTQQQQQHWRSEEKTIPIHM